MFLLLSFLLLCSYYNNFYFYVPIMIIFPLCEFSQGTDYHHHFYIPPVFNFLARSKYLSFRFPSVSLSSQLERQNPRVDKFFFYLLINGKFSLLIGIIIIIITPLRVFHTSISW